MNENSRSRKLPKWLSKWNRKLPKWTRGQNRSQNGSHHDPKINPKYKHEKTKTKSVKTEEPPTFFGRAFWVVPKKDVFWAPKFMTLCWSRTTKYVILFAYNTFIREQIEKYISWADPKVIFLRPFSAPSRFWVDLPVRIKF